MRVATSSLVRGGVAIGATLALSAGCALIVGDPVGHATFQSDATPSEKPDVESGRADASGHDAKSHEAAPSDAVSHDATGHDSGAPDVTTTVDVLTKDGSKGEAGATDGREPDAPGGDAGFCATYQAPVGFTAYCEDFDEPPHMSFSGSITIASPGGSVIVEDTTSRSPSYALEAKAFPGSVDGSAAGVVSEVVTYLSEGTVFALAWDMMLASGPTSGVDYMNGFLFNPNMVGQPERQSAVVLGIMPRLPNGDLQVAIVEGQSDGGLATHPPVSLSVGGWFHVEMTVSSTPIGYVDSLVVNGQVIEENVLLPSTFSVATPSGVLGWTLAIGTGDAVAYIDNVVMLSK